LLEKRSVQVKSYSGWHVCTSGGKFLPALVHSLNCH
jgi:hypothetical protein